jgi:hypothetical protein
MIGILHSFIFHIYDNVEWQSTQWLTIVKEYWNERKLYKIQNKYKYATFKGPVTLPKMWQLQFYSHFPNKIYKLVYVPGKQANLY